MIKPKVLLLGKLPPPYIGPSIATEILLKSGLNQYFELIHLDTKVNENIHAFGKWNLGKVVKNFNLYARIRHLLKVHQPDLVLIPISQTTTGFFKDSLFILICRFFHVKVLLQLRGSNFKTWISHSSYLNKRYVKWVLHKTAGIIVLGENLKQLFFDYYPANRIFVVPNGGDYMIPEKKKQGECKVLYLANLLGSKGIEDVFKAIELLQSQTTIKYSVDLVGAWYNKEEERRCLDIKEKGNLPINIHTPKGLDEKFNFLANADIFVFPPREPEGHPWCIIEAMASGLPVISTNQGAIIESVKEGLNGFIIESNNPVQLAEKIKYLMENPEQRKKMGEAGRSIYLANFTEKKMVERLTNVFNQLIKS